MSTPDNNDSGPGCAGLAGIAFGIILAIIIAANAGWFNR
jgi:hypothetical protein